MAAETCCGFHSHRVLPWRARRTRYSSSSVRLKGAHCITLPGEDVLHGGRDMLWFPQPSCAAMARPSLAVQFIQPQTIQTSAGVSFEVAHDSLRRNLRFHHRMHVIASHMGRQQTPATMRTNLPNHFQDGVATNLVEVIGRLVHALPLKGGKRRILLQYRRSRHIVRAIDGAGFAAVYRSEERRVEEE